MNDNLGKSYGKLIVVSRAGSSAEGRARWLCRCACGTQVLATSKQLTKGHLRGCPSCQDSGSQSTLSVRLLKYTIAENECWHWTGKQNQHGYGAITVAGVETRAHRAAYFLLYPEADRTKVVMHTCDNPPCINPAHLKLGTQRDNMLDMHAKGRFRGGPPLGNKNAIGNQGWRKGGITAKYVASKPGNEVEIPKELT